MNRPLPGAPARPLTVTELVASLKRHIEGDDLFADLWVLGETSNLKMHTSGHLYFTLKDDTASIRAVMFRSHARYLRFAPASGQKVLVRGSIGVFERDGQVQLYATDLEPYGVGAAHLALQALKERLEAEGLFAPERKRPLPLVPRRVGVVTAAGGAALRDIVAVSRRRHRRIDILLAPAQVQGEGSAASVVTALSRIGRAGVDVVILGRGGGAAEDLSVFNREEVVRAVAACPVPVVSAVGHQTDYTLVDFAADLRMPTPSAAAERVVPELWRLEERVQELSARLRRALRQRHDLARRRLDSLQGRTPFSRPYARLETEAQRLDRLLTLLERGTRGELRLRRERLHLHAARLAPLSPLAVLERGYAIVTRPQAKGQVVVRRATEVSVGEGLTVRLREGRLRVAVEEVSGE